MSDSKIKKVFQQSIFILLHWIFEINSPDWPIRIRAHPLPFSSSNERRVRRCCPPIEHSLSKAEPCDKKHSERDYTRVKKRDSKKLMTKIIFLQRHESEWSKKDESYNEKIPKRDTKLLKLFLWFLWWHFQGLEMNWSNPKYKARGVDLSLGQSPNFFHQSHFSQLAPTRKKDSFNDLMIIHHQNDSNSWEIYRAKGRSFRINWRESARERAI